MKYRQRGVLRFIINNIVMQNGNIQKDGVIM